MNLKIKSIWFTIWTIKAAMNRRGILGLDIFMGLFGVLGLGLVLLGAVLQMLGIGNMPFFWLTTAPVINIYHFGGLLIMGIFIFYVWLTE